MPGRPGMPSGPVKSMAMHRMDGTVPRRNVTKRSKRLNVGPKKRQKMPSCPQHLDPIAKRMWKKYIQQVYDFGLVGEWDGELFGSYCDYYAMYVRAKKEVLKAGAENWEIKTGKGSTSRSKQLVNMTDLHKEWMRIGSELGLTPRARTMMGIEPGEEDNNPLSSILKLTQSKKVSGA